MIENVRPIRLRLNVQEDEGRIRFQCQIPKRKRAYPGPGGVDEAKDQQFRTLEGSRRTSNRQIRVARNKEDLTCKDTVVTDQGSLGRVFNPKAVKIGRIVHERIE